MFHFAVLYSFVILLWALYLSLFSQIPFYPVYNTSTATVSLSLTFSGSPSVPLYVCLSCYLYVTHRHALLLCHFQANNLVLHTAVKHFWQSRETEEREGLNSSQQNGRAILPHLVISNVEHDSIRLTAEHLQKEGRAGRTASLQPVLPFNTLWVSTEGHFTCLNIAKCCLTTSCSV